MNPRLLFIAALLAGASAQAEQKTVYRCGQTYQDSPCPGGKVVEVAANATADAAMIIIDEHEFLHSDIRSTNKVYYLVTSIEVWRSARCWK